MILSIFTELCNHHHNQLKNIFVTSKRNLVLFSYHPLNPHLLTTTNLLSVSVDFPILDISYK